MGHGGCIPEGQEEPGRGSREPVLEAGALSWCPTYTTPSLIGFPKPFVWKENTRPRCHAHPRKTCRGRSTPFSAAYAELAVMVVSFETWGVRTVGLFSSLPIAHRQWCALACWAGRYGKTNPAGLGFAVPVSRNASAHFGGSAVECLRL